MFRALPRRMLTLLCAVIAGTTPLLVWLALHGNFLPQLLILLAGMWLLRLLTSSRAASGRTATRVTAAAAGVLCLVALLSGHHRLVLLYPVLVNAVCGCVFGLSLYHGIPVAERFARLTHPQPDEHLKTYTRRVTQIWTLFFAVNGTIALFTVIYGDIDVWTWWNGCISYLLAAVLFAVELIARSRFKRKIRHDRL